jgi:hypothetical protein
MISHKVRSAQTFPPLSLQTLKRTNMTFITAEQERNAVKQVRSDFRTRDVINQAIASIPTVGLQRAAEFLSAMNVPAELAIRTLVYPNRRRQVV